MALRIVAISGLTGSSKSTVAEIIANHLADRPFDGPIPKVMAMDTSRLLENSKKANTASGRKLKEMESDQLEGKVLHHDAVIGSLKENFRWLSEYPALEVLLLAGSPRAVEEAEYLNQLEGVRFVLIRATEQEVAVSIDGRIKSGKMREDDGPRTLSTKIVEFRSKIEPSFNLLPEHKVLRIDRSMPLVERVTRIVDHMYVPDSPEQSIIPARIHHKWKCRLGERSHPVHEAIRKIEMGVLNHRESSSVHNAGVLVSAAT